MREIIRSMSDLEMINHYTLLQLLLNIEIQGLVSIAKENSNSRLKNNTDLYIKDN